MDTFDLGETVICSITVKDADANLQDPVTSMKIVIDRVKPNFTNIVSSTAMTKDSTGTYHYDFQTSSVTIGTYEIEYTATDGSRISIQKDEFILE